MSEAIINIKNLTKIYDDVPAVEQLSLSINKGEIFGLLGPNGAGKSTTIFMLLGLTEPTSGSIKVCGIDSTKSPLGVKQRVGYLPDDLGFYQNMTGLENLLYTAQLNGISREVAEKRAHHLLNQVGLEDAIHKKTGKYSRGMKQRLGLADVLIKEPEVIILDEPTLGIDPKGVRELLHLIKKLNQEKNLTVLLSSHHLHQVQQVCDRVGIFVKGKLLAKGTLNELALQLFGNDNYVVHVEANPITERLLNEIKELPEVTYVNQITATSIDVFCKKDITPTIAKKFMDDEIELSNISKKNYGLDEIYHRYFEGRESNETA
ncbi:ABC transporter ATP-binding protein [Ornithinibacillus halophilus]|uniref:ABC-2 type transport system ATP-binding protein n=1 Tax=Ornithinibacillus halophilus TaxID=930117 RepID=A0A1M5HYZ8_9BACI|nr:ABC transporter ATP-binding protein [Ornithinibacillus halophilus]SHG21177.1 ABC-2 type transport system ATP-binding protein [Ornithinibacillus halophilus]